VINAQANSPVLVGRRGHMWRSWRTFRWLGLCLLVALGVAVLAAVVLLRRPALAPDEARGLYAAEGQGQRFHWTGSLVRFPVHARGGPTHVELTISAGRWPGRAPQQVVLAADVALAKFEAPERARRYLLLLPPSVDAVVLRTTVTQPPGDARWLGVQLHGVRASATGTPWQTISVVALLAFASVPATFGAGWLVRRGYGGIAALAVLGLLLRVYDLARVPAGFFQDEAVSLVDAWHLAQTGHDHLGHLLPIGALEAFGDWISPLFTFLAVPIVALFGPTLLAGRLLAALAGALAVPAIYALARALRMPLAAALIAALVAALSPWQILRSRAATPPALVPLCWALLVLAGLLFVRWGRRRDALWLAAAAGVSLYAYPTMKLAVPLFVALAVALALMRHGWRAARSWLPAALLLALLWLPFASVTLLNPDSGMRAQSKLLRADSAAAWLAEWARGYTGYFLPGFLYQTGDPSNGMPDVGVQLPIEAPLVLLGLGVLLWRCRIWDFGFGIDDRKSKIEWWLIAGATLLAPLPASVMFPNPHLTRSLIVAPMYALLAGLGVVVFITKTPRLAGERYYLLARRAALVLLAAGLLWQGGLRFADYLDRFPALIASKYQDGMFEAMQAAVQAAPQFDEVWIDDRMTFPYIFVLAAQPMPPAQAQAQIIVRHGRTTFNTVDAIGRYRFKNLAALDNDLPVVEALPTPIGRPGFVLQEWHEGSRRVLIVRRMRAA
jgi:4-amino-4-deoxy-L-arabinose transferase-like glycosyltransferase